jgi:hypothetical protein
MHDSRGTWLTRRYRRAERSWPSDTHGKPVIHESVIERTRNRNNEDDPTYSPWILNGEYDYELEPPRP